MTKLYRYQKEGVRLISKFGGRVLLADEMGLGKSIQALSWCRRKERYPIIVICPASLKYNWEREALTHFNMRAEVLEGRKPPRSWRVLKACHVIVINYDILKDWVPILLKLQPRALIVDEAHYIKNTSSQRTGLVWRLASKIPKVIALTGTPLISRPAELWSILHMLEPDVYDSPISFGLRYCRATRKYGQWHFKGAENLEELNEELSHIMIRRRKADVLKDLPVQREYVVPLPIENREEYDKAVHDFRKWLFAQNPAAMSSALRAEKLNWWGHLRRLVGRLKLAAVIEWIENTLEETDEKLIVFGIHQKILAKLHERFSNESVVINGLVQKRARQRLVDQFQNKPSTRLLLGNIQAAGVGLNLTAASKVAFCELGWTPAEHSQAAARIDRIGQVKENECYFLVGYNTMEETLCKIIQRKQEISDKVLDGQLLGKLNVMGLLEKAMFKEIKGVRSGKSKKS